MTHFRDVIYQKFIEFKVESLNFDLSFFTTRIRFLKFPHDSSVNNQRKHILMKNKLIIFFSVFTTLLKINKLFFCFLLIISTIAYSQILSWLGYNLCILHIYCTNLSKFKIILQIISDATVLLHNNFLDYYNLQTKFSLFYITKYRTNVEDIKKSQVSFLCKIRLYKIIKSSPWISITVHVITSNRDKNNFIFKSYLYWIRSSLTKSKDKQNNDYNLNLDRDLKF